jgi:small subunit ribosomal protein S20
VRLAIGSPSLFRLLPVLDLDSTPRREGFRTVANIKSQKKRILTNAKAAHRNKAVKSELRTRVKTAMSAVDSADDTDTQESVRLAVKRLDMAAAKRIIHPNQAARRKSRLMKRVNEDS